MNTWHTTHREPYWSSQLCAALQSSSQIQPLSLQQTQTKSELKLKPEAYEAEAEVIFKTYAHLSPGIQSSPRSLNAVSSVALFHAKKKEDCESADLKWC